MQCYQKLELRWKIGTEHRTAVRSTVNRNPVRFIYLSAIAHGNRIPYFDIVVATRNKPKRSKKGWRAFEGTGRFAAFLKQENTAGILPEMGLSIYTSLRSTVSTLTFIWRAIVTPFTLLYWLVVGRTEVKIQQQQMDLG